MFHQPVGWTDIFQSDLPDNFHAGAQDVNNAAARPPDLSHFLSIHEDGGSGGEPQSRLNCFLFLCHTTLHPIPPFLFFSIPGEQQVAA